MHVLRVYALFSLALALIALLLAPRACAQDMRGRLFMRVALGGGYGGIGSEVADDDTNNVGYALAWDAAFGAFLHPAVALHVSAFGHYQPSSVTKRDEAPRQRGNAFIQNSGLGFTLTPPRDFVHAPRLRPFLSASLGISLVNDSMESRNQLGFGAQLLGGLELRTNAELRIGLALQGSYTTKPDGPDVRPIQAGHIAGLLTFAYDTRPRAETR